MDTHRLVAPEAVQDPFLGAGHALEGVRAIHPLGAQEADAGLIGLTGDDLFGTVRPDQRNGFLLIAYGQFQRVVLPVISVIERQLHAVKGSGQLDHMAFLVHIPLRFAEQDKFLSALLHDGIHTLGPVLFVIIVIVRQLVDHALRGGQQPLVDEGVILVGHDDNAQHAVDLFRRLSLHYVGGQTAAQFVREVQVAALIGDTDHLYGKHQIRCQIPVLGVTDIHGESAADHACVAHSHHFIHGFRQTACGEEFLLPRQQGHRLQKQTAALQSHAPLHGFGFCFKPAAGHQRVVVIKYVLVFPIEVADIGDVAVALQGGDVLHRQEGVEILLGQIRPVRAHRHDAGLVPVGECGGIVKAGSAVVRIDDKGAQKCKHRKGGQCKKQSHDGAPHRAGPQLHPGDIAAQLLLAGGRGFTLLLGCGGEFSQRRVHGHPAVLQNDAAGCTVGGFLKFVGNEDHQPVPGRLGQQGDHLFAVLPVQISGGLIRQQDGCGLGKSAGNGQALLLSAGQLGCPALPQFPQLHFPEDGLRLGLGLLLLHTGQTQGADHVAQHRAAGKDTVILRNKADLIPAVALPVSAVIVGGGLPVQQQLAALIGQEAAQYVSQRGLAAAALAGDGHKLSGAEGQADTVQAHDHLLPGGIVLGYVTECEQFLPHERHPLSKSNLAKSYHKVTVLSISIRVVPDVSGCSFFKKIRTSPSGFFVQISIPLQWSISCWMIWAVQPVQVLKRVWNFSVWYCTLMVL